MQIFKYFYKKPVAKLLLVIIAAFMVGAAGACVFSPDISFVDLVKLDGGIAYATIIGALTGNYPDPSAKDKHGKPIRNRFFLISDDQVDYDAGFPQRVGRSYANIPLLAGQFWKYFETPHNSPPNFSSSSEQGDGGNTNTNTATIILSGASDDLMKLLETGQGKGFYGVFDDVYRNEKWLGGSYGRPMVMQSYEWNNNEQTMVTITFAYVSAEVWSKYTGTTPTQTPATVPADATTITLTSNPQYQLTDGSASSVAITSFTSVTDNDVNRIVTVLGSGGTYPSTIETGADFLLDGGVTWTSNAGSQISFKIFKDNTGTYKFIEVSGSRIQT